MRKVVTNSPMSTLRKFPAELMKTGTAVSTKTIQCKLFLEFSLESCKPAQKPRMKKKIFGLRQEKC